MFTNISKSPGTCIRINIWIMRKSYINVLGHRPMLQKKLGNDFNVLWYTMMKSPFHLPFLCVVSHALMNACLLFITFYERGIWFSDCHEYLWNVKQQILPSLLSVLLPEIYHFWRTQQNYFSVTIGQSSLFISANDK